MSGEPILQVSGLCKTFGSLAALNAVSFQIARGEILGLIGPNGAGKTTLFNTISGLYRPDGGQVAFRGQSIGGMPPHKICKLGLSRTFQVTQAFEHLSVAEAIRIGAYNRHGERGIEAKVRETVAFFGLEKIQDWKCADLGLAPLKRVEVARAAATDPKLLLLDEAGAGLNSSELSELMEMLKTLRRERELTLCVVEHVMPMVMGLCERIIVLDYGELIAEGTPEMISKNEKVIEAYLGRRSKR
jgi:branched-chain amino acid transport system ATP-binding protein